MNRTTTLFKLSITLLLGLIYFLPLKATIWEVEVSDFVFTPDNLTEVMVGDTIHWVWIEGNHTTTSSDIPAGAAAWDELITSSNTEYSYVPTVPGTYDYVCTPHASFGMVGSFTVMNIDGIFGSSQKRTFAIAPNPFKDQLVISSLENYGMNVKQLKVYNSSGQEVLSQQWNTSGSFSKRIDLAEQKQGIYFVEIIEQSGEAIRQKVIKK